MNIKQIRYFISVAHTGSFSAAARDEGVSVQAMSKAMADLEKETRAPLFERNHQGVNLTPFGSEFLVKAEQVVREFSELEEFADISNENATKLKAMLCAPVFLNNIKARADIASFIKTHTGIEAEVTIGKPTEGMDLLHKGAVDVLVTVGPLHQEGIDCINLGTVPTGICVAKNHPLAKRQTVTLDDISQHPVIFSEPFDQFNDSVLNTYLRARDGLTSVKMKSFFESSKLFYADHGVCFMAFVSQLGEMLPFSSMIPIAEEDHIPIPICLVTLSDRKTPAYARIEKLFTSI